MFRKCYMCRFFNRYFIREETEFRRTEFGFCIKKQETARVGDTCDSYIRKAKPFCYGPAIDLRLDGILTELTVLRNFMEEECREKEEETDL